MIDLNDSEKSIKGLAKLIIQEPRLIPNLRIIREALHDEGVLSEKAKDENYFEDQDYIIKQAEKVANEYLWYAFSLHDTFRSENKGYMVYRRVDDRMVPVQESFEGGAHSDFLDAEDLLEFLKENKIEKVITYNPWDLDTVYHQQYELEPEEEENDSGFSYEHSHMELCYGAPKLLEDNGIKIIKFNDEEVREFEKDLSFAYPNP